MSSNGQTLEQRTEQRQIATQQTIRLMQMVEQNFLSLEQEILKEVAENPALETYSEDDDLAAPAPEDCPAEEFDTNGDPLELTDKQPNEDVFDEEFFGDEGYDNDDFDDHPSEWEIERQIAYLNAPDRSEKRDSVGVYQDSQRELWQQQLGEMALTPQEYLLANYMMGNLDERGYLTTDFQALVNELIYNENVYTTVAELERVLTQVVQELDPPGTGARDLQECLLLQLRRLDANDESLQHAIRIVRDCFEALKMKHYDRIRQNLAITTEQLRAAMKVIGKLVPRPADSNTPMENAAGIITPDFTVTSQNGKLQLFLNDQYVPKVRINKEFSNAYRFMTKEQMKQKREKADEFIKTYVDRGEQFVNMLDLRKQIMFNTMYAIMRRQRDYFLTGDDACLKPMILRDIAEEVSLDISTISRFSNNKYVQTDFGVVPIKYLFSEAVNDEDKSSKEIKSMLSGLIGAEDKRKPLSDEKLCQLLQEKGYDIARRTVAKYREQLNIPVARLRKEI